MGLLDFLIRTGYGLHVDNKMREKGIEPMGWLISRGMVVLVLIAGWVFIAWQNKFHLTAPVFFVCVGYLAVVMTIVNLWRTGASAMGPEDQFSEWARPLGARGELEREKKTLLKAIKEAEFDHEMGKLSRADADGMIQTYRARAIEVIKQLEQLEKNDMAVDPAGRPLGQLTVRDQIAREVKARLEVAKAAKSKKKKAKGEDKQDVKPEEPPAEAKAEDKVEATT